MSRPKKRETVYKVCKKVDGTLRSAYHENLGNLSAEYALGKDTRPKVGRLFAFTSLDDAEQFAHGVPGRVVYVADAIVASRHDPMRDFVMAPNANKDVTQAARRWWKWLESGGPQNDRPEGVVLGWQCARPFCACTRIRLVREVE